MLNHVFEMFVTYDIPIFSWDDISKYWTMYSKCW
jgi:hypothetical protein